jgi:hypothetical protein
MPALRRILLLFVLLVVASRTACALDQVSEVPPPKHWDKFTILVWQYHTNVARDKDLYASVNLKGFHIDRKDAEHQAFAKETGWPFYVDHAASKGYLHLTDKVRESISRKKEVIVRPNSLADPKTIDAMKAHLKENVDSAKGSTAVAYAFDDEISLGNFCSPIEADAHPLSVAQYQRALENTYKTIEVLNAQYGSSYANFASIQPKSFENFRAQIKPANIAKLNLSQWCDWRSYMDTQFAECLADLTRYTNTLDGSTPAGFVGGQSPNAFGGYDYRKLCKSVQWMEAYDIGGCNEILRSFWSQKSAHVQTFFSSENPKQDAWFLWYYLCHGNRGLICWPNSKSGDWFANGKVAGYIVANSETFKEVQGPVSQKIIDGEFVHDPVAIYYSHPSIQVTWAFDAECHGSTWPNRSSSMDNMLNTSSLTRVGWIKTLEDLGIQAKFIHMDNLLDGALQKGGFKVLLLNRALCLSDSEVTAIKSFSDNGGTVIADHLCGIFDEHGKARAAGALDELFGVSRDVSKGWLDGAALTEVNAETDYSKLSTKNWAVNAPLYKEMAVFERGLKTSAKSTGESAGGASVRVRNGKSVYLNLSPIGYLIKRSTDAVEPWRALIGGLLKDAGVEARVKLSIAGKPATQTESIFWKNGERTTLCIIKNLDRKAAIDGFGSMDTKLEDAKLKLKLQFAKPVKDLKNERTGKELGGGSDFEDDFTPWEANVYTYGN